MLRERRAAPVNSAGRMAVALMDPIGQSLTLWWCSIGWRLQARDPKFSVVRPYRASRRDFLDACRSLGIYAVYSLPDWRLTPLMGARRAKFKKELIGVVARQMEELYPREEWRLKSIDTLSDVMEHLREAKAAKRGPARPFAVTARIFANHANARRDDGIRALGVSLLKELLEMFEREGFQISSAVWKEILDPGR